MLRFVVFPLFFLLFHFPTFAFSGSTPSTPLAEQRTWLKLLHFDQQPNFGAAYSAVADEAFFLSSEGRYNPSAELNATIAALELPDPGDGSHASCKFPARAMWLAQQGVVTPVNATCTERDTWLKQRQHNEVGVVFASGYMGNPASFFGHMLLHLGSVSQDQNPIQLLDTSLNFGADTSGDGIVPYIVKGLVGGYQARYSNVPFFRNTDIYSESEMRDMWHYEFAFSEADRAFLIAHMWEVLGQKFDYLFLNENCASRIARTLELVIDAELTESSMPWVAPEQVMIHLSNATYNGQPVVRSRMHKPSRRYQTEQHFHQLSAEQQGALEDVWQDPNTLNFAHPRFRRLSTTDRGPVVDVILSHLITLEENNSELNIPALRQTALLARLQLPTSPAFKVTEVPAPIEQATPSSMLRTTAVAASQRDTALRLSFRPMHYDILQGNNSRMPYAGLEIGRVELDVTGHDVRLHHLQILDVTNLNPKRTPLHEVRALAWQMKLGVGNRSLACNNCLDTSAELNVGWSDFYNGWVPFALVGAQLRTTAYQDGFLALTLNAGMFRMWSEQQSSYLTVSHNNAFQGELGRSTELRLQHRYQLSRESDIRLHLASDRYGAEAGVGYSWYW